MILPLYANPSMRSSGSTIQHVSRRSTAAPPPLVCTSSALKGTSRMRPSSVIPSSAPLSSMSPGKTRNGTIAAAPLKTATSRPKRWLAQSAPVTDSGGSFRACAAARSQSNASSFLRGSSAPVVRGRSTAKDRKLSTALFASSSVSSWAALGAAAHWHKRSRLPSSSTAISCSPSLQRASFASARAATTCRFSWWMCWVRCAPEADSSPGATSR
mmetsp:Transcript_7674/g.25418  ORF Transcript_7674/g.25418 Transcript_7674/m.25418 type:complete len:214 (-) Transcript_7674:160-801(-)